MEMKNLFLGMFLLAIAGLGTGCSNDRVVDASGEKQAISFRVQGGTPTLRATGTTIDYVNAFVVNAYGNASVDPIMNAITVYRMEGTSTSFDYNPKAYFRTSDTYADFAAYSPVSKHITSGLKDDDTNQIAYDIQVPDPTGATAQEDLLVAYTHQTTLTGAPVSLGFRHALSRVYVTAVNTLSEDVIITSLKLVNLYRSGELEINADIENAYESSVSVFSDYKVLWNPTGSQNNTFGYVLPQSGVSVASGTNTRTYVVSKEQGMLILPQTTLNANDAKVPGGEDDFYLEVMYKLSNTTDIVKIPFEDITSLTPDADQGLTFEFGRQYALNINFESTANLVEIKFSVTVEAWDEPVIEVP